MTTRPMQRSWLVQRLRKPRKNEGISSGPFAFGGRGTCELFGAEVPA